MRYSTACRDCRQVVTDSSRAQARLESARLESAHARRVDAYFAPISAGLPYIEQGRLRPLAITSAKRATQLPDVPRIAEAGVPRFEFSLWFGLWGPAGIAPVTVAKVRKDFGAALADAALREKLGSLGNEIMVMEPAQFRKYI